MSTAVENGKSLSVVVSGFNGFKNLKNFLPSVVSAYENYGGKKEFIVSGLDPKKYIEDFTRKNYPFIKFIKSPRKNNLPTDLNLASAKAKNEILFFVTAPIKPDKNYFTAFSKYFTADNVFALTGCGLDIKNGSQIYGLKTGEFKYGLFRLNDILNRDLNPAKSPFKSFSMQGNCFFVSREKFELLGGFDEIYSPTASVPDLSYRGLKQGFDILYAPDLISRHTISELSLSGEVTEAKNDIIFGWKHLTLEKYKKKHTLFLCVRLLTLNLFYWAGFLKAVRLCRQIRKKHKEETKKAVFTEEHILKFFENQK